MWFWIVFDNTCNFCFKCNSEYFKYIQFWHTFLFSILVRYAMMNSFYNDQYNSDIVFKTPIGTCDSEIVLWWFNSDIVLVQILSDYTKY